MRTRGLTRPQVVVSFGLMTLNRLRNITIVVVEDDEDTRMYLSIFLGRLGANVVAAEDAFKGLAAVKTHKPNLVVSDITMPGRDGFGLLRDIRALGPDAGGSIPVVAMTALATHVDRVRILYAGFQAYVPKPSNPDELVKAILTVLKHEPDVWPTDAGASWSHGSN